MTISSDMLGNYLSYITNLWMIHNGEEQADNLNEYHAYVMRIKNDLQRCGDLEPFRLGIDYLLCNSEIDLTISPYNYQEYYGWENDELRELLQYIRETIYVDKSLDCKEVEDVKLIPISRIDWWDSRIELQPKNYQQAWEKRTGQKLASYND